MQRITESIVIDLRVAVIDTQWFYGQD